jgi:hypothetical protein
LAACSGATSRGGEDAARDGIARGANCWLEAAIGTSAGSLAKVAANCWLDAATGKFAGSLAGVAAGMAATVVAGEGSWLDAARFLLPSLSRGYKLLTSLSRGSSLRKTAPSSSITSKASLGILPRQRRSTSLSTRAKRMCWRSCWALPLAATVGINNISC